LSEFADRGAEGFMGRSRKFYLSLAGVVAVATTGLLYFVFAPPQGAYAYFTYDSFDDGDIGTMEYALYLPPDYRRHGSLPLVVFLHGPAQRGGDGRKQLTDGLGPVIAARVRSGKAFEFVALFPQSFTGSWHPKSDDGRLFLKVLASVKEHYPVDPDRVYLTGVSEGATGVWRLAAHCPDQWAAIVPVSGRPDPESAAAIKHIPCWCFQGGVDSVVQPAEVRRMMEALRPAGGKPRYTEYPGRGSDISLAPYADPKLFEWMLSRRRAPGSE
jgi:predicted peptidase